MKNLTLLLLVLSACSRVAVPTKKLPDCWFIPLVNDVSIHALSSEQVRVLPSPEFTDITLSYDEKTGNWMVKLRAARHLPPSSIGYARFSGYAAYPPLQRHKDTEPTVVAFALPTKDKAESFFRGLARLHAIPAEHSRMEDKFTWP